MAGEEAKMLSNDATVVVMAAVLFYAWVQIVRAVWEDILPLTGVMLIMFPGMLLGTAAILVAIQVMQQEIEIARLWAELGLD